MSDVPSVPIPADAALLRFLADDIAHTFDCASQDDACICGAAHHAARLRALAAEMERESTDAARMNWLVSEHGRVDPMCALVAKVGLDRNGHEWGNVSNPREEIDRMMALPNVPVPAQRGDR